MRVVIARAFTDVATFLASIVDSDLHGKKFPLLYMITIHRSPDYDSGTLPF